jgi:hypothetical protein
MCPSSTVVKHSIINLKVKASVPPNDTWREKMGERYFDVPSRTVVEHFTYNLKIKGSKPATDTWREKMGERYVVDILMYPASQWWSTLLMRSRVQSLPLILAERKW